MRCLALRKFDWERCRHSALVASAAATQSAWRSVELAPRAANGTAVRVRTTIKPHVVRCILDCPADIRIRTDDEWIVVSCVSEVLRERLQGLLAGKPPLDCHPKICSAFAHCSLERAGKDRAEADWPNQSDIGGGARDVGACPLQRRCSEELSTGRWASQPPVWNGVDRGAGRRGIRVCCRVGSTATGQPRKRACNGGWSEPLQPPQRHPA